MFLHLCNSNYTVNVIVYQYDFSLEINFYWAKKYTSVNVQVRNSNSQMLWTMVYFGWEHRMPFTMYKILLFFSYIFYGNNLICKNNILVEKMQIYTDSWSQVYFCSIKETIMYNFDNLSNKYLKERLHVKLLLFQPQSIHKLISSTALQNFHTK